MNGDGVGGEGALDAVAGDSGAGGAGGGGADAGQYSVGGSYGLSISDGVFEVYVAIVGVTKNEGGRLEVSRGAN